MDSVRDFYAFEWISVAMGCWRWGETSVGNAALLWSIVEKVAILISGIKNGFHTIWPNVMVVPMLFCSADSPISLCNQIGCLTA